MISLAVYTTQMMNPIQIFDDQLLSVQQAQLQSRMWLQFSDCIKMDNQRTPMMVDFSTDYKPHLSIYHLVSMSI